MMLRHFSDGVKLGQLYPMKKVFGIGWKANVTTACGIAKAFGGKYASFSAFLEVVNSYLGTLNHVNKEDDDWWMLNASFVGSF